MRIRGTKIKALHGRGRKLHWWKNVLHEVLRDEFSRLRTAGVKINTDFLCRTVISLFRDNQTAPVSEHDVIEAKVRNSLKLYPFLGFMTSVTVIASLNVFEPETSL